MTRLAATVLVALMACTDGLPTTVVLTPADLPEVVLQAAEAPEGTEYRAMQSRPEDLEKFGRPGEQQTTLAANGFKGAYRVSLSSDAYVDHPSDPREWGDGVALVENQVVVLKDAGGARKVLEYYRTFTVGPTQSPDLKPVDAPGLGEQAYGLRGLVVRTAPAIVLYWRRGNVFLSLGFFGNEPLDMQSALALAKAIDARIAARAA